LLIASNLTMLMRACTSIAPFVFESETFSSPLDKFRGRPGCRLAFDLFFQTAALVCLLQRVENVALWFQG